MVAAEIVVKDQIDVVSSWSEKDMVKQIPGASWDGDDKVWRVPLTWAACQQLRGIFGKDLAVGQKLTDWAKADRAQRVRPALDLRSKVEVVDDQDDDPLWGKLYSFQRAGVQFLDTAESALLTDEMGTGKTIQMLTTLRAKLAGATPALVICPNSVKGSWRNEAAKWYPEATVYMVSGTATKRRKILESAAADASALVIINFESVRLHSRTAGFGSTHLKRCHACGGAKNTTVTEAQCEVHERELNKIPFGIVVVDEAHRIKDGQAKQTRAVWATGQNPTVQHRYAMTGTPVANDASDLWSIMHFVNPSEYPTKSKFVSRYCKTSFNEFGGLEIGGLNPATKDELYNFLNPRMRRTLKADVLTQLPPKVFMTRTVQLSATVQKAYEEMEDSLFTRLPDGSLMVAGSPLASRTRLIQFSSAAMEQSGSHLDKKTGETVVDYKMCEPAPKLDVMEEVLEELKGEPLVVAAVHKQLIDLAETRLIKAGISYGKITGDVPQWQRDLYVQKFQAGELQVMLLTMQAGGTGITLTRAHTMLRLQCSWSMIDNKQTVDRIHRIGSEQHQQVTIIDVITEGTIEVDQVAKVQNKHMILQEVVQDDEIV